MLIILFLVAAVLLGLSLERRRKKSVVMVKKPNYYLKLKPTDKRWVIAWFFMTAIYAILMAIFGGWLLLFGAIYILPLAIALRMSVRVVLIGRWSKVNLLTKITTSYIFVVFLVFTRSVTDSTYNPFILFGAMPEQGSNVDVFLSQIEMATWITTACAFALLFGLYIASKSRRRIN